MKTTITLTTIAAALFGAAAANAAMLIEQPAAQPAPVEEVKVTPPAGRKAMDLHSRLTSRITQSGTPPRELPPIKGMGQDVLVADSLKQIVPAGWRVYVEQDIPEDLTVTWSGNRNWPMALNMVLTELDMKAEIDWNRGELSLLGTPNIKSKAQPAPSREELQAALASAEADKAKAVAEAEAAKAESVKAEEAAKAEAAKVEAAKAAAPKSWTLSPDMFLRENIRAWLETEGWSLEWQASVGDRVINYPVNVGATLTGQLIGEGGVIDRLIQKFESADEPLGVRFFRGNKVAVVYLYSATSPVIQK